MHGATIKIIKFGVFVFVIRLPLHYSILVFIELLIGNGGPG